MDGWNDGGMDGWISVNYLLNCHDVMNLAAQWRSGSTWQRRTVIPAVPKCATVFGSDSTERENKQVATLKKKMLR